MATNEEFDYLFKIVIIGDSGVGKTNILLRISEGTFNPETKTTIGVQFATKTKNIDGVIIKNQIWDTAGQQKYRAITNAYYRGAHGVIIVYDLTKSVTFENVNRWLKELKQHAEPDVILMMIGNKCDLQNRDINQDTLKQFIQKNELLYLQTSALTGKNIDEAFNTLVKQIYDKNKNVETSTPAPKAQVSSQKQGQKNIKKQSGKNHINSNVNDQKTLKLNDKNIENKTSNSNKKQCC